MYELKPKTAEELKARALVRVEEKITESVRFFSPQEERPVQFGDRGLLPLTEGRIYRTTYKRPKKPSSTSVYLELFGFDELHRGTELAVASGLWAPEYLTHKARGKISYMGGVELLPSGLLKDAIALLDHTGGIDLEPPPWEHN